MAESAAESLGLFEGYGVEIEYMVADADSLDVRPSSDLVLRDPEGRPVSEVERGGFAWSNELVMHVLELKTAGPAGTLGGLAEGMHGAVVEMARALEAHGLVLVPGGAHPWMDPAVETVLWPHEYHEIYSLYDRIFDCRRHGWANLQSSHLNLPFQGDDEFARLHAAVRLILPLLPGLAASTPILEGRITGFHDTRLEVYRHNQERLPLVTGSVIPERVWSEREYGERIFEPLAEVIDPLDSGGVIPPWVLNSRGAIARFERGSIEIRLLDAQECPSADLGIHQLVVAGLRRMIEGEWSDLARQKEMDERRLLPILLEGIRRGEEAVVEDRELLEHFGLRGSRVRMAGIWEHLAISVEGALDESATRAIGAILDRGTLASRILRRVSPEPERVELRELCRELSECLLENRLLE